MLATILLCGRLSRTALALTARLGSVSLGYSCGEERVCQREREREKKREVLSNIQASVIVCVTFPWLLLFSCSVYNKRQENVHTAQIRWNITKSNSVNSPSAYCIVTAVPQLKVINMDTSPCTTTAKVKAVTVKNNCSVEVQNAWCLVSTLQTQVVDEQARDAVFFK